MRTKKRSADSAAQEPQFPKDALLRSRRFRRDCDLVAALLEDGKEYTVSEVDVIIANFRKGKVN